MKLADMTELEYRISFNTPAFLGNAEQNAQWRTPPFKALIRHWWRVVYAPTVNYEWKQLREEEGQLFGHAWLKTDRNYAGNIVNSRKSKVLMRLERWAPGTFYRDWPGGSLSCVGQGNVRADLYLGYGPVLAPNRKEGRSSIELRGPSIDTNEKNKLLISFPEQSKLESVVELIGWFGALGGRSRNGWGSLQIDEIELPIIEKLQYYTRDLSDCLEVDWPHALGRDGRGILVWVTEAKKDWRAVMSVLAYLKVDIRSQAKRSVGDGGISGIHLLGYPAGSGWNLKEFGNTARLAAQLRYKVAKTRNGLIGVIYHLPCKMPSVLRDKLSSMQKRWLDSNELDVWQSIHRYLDRSTKLERLT